MADLFPTNRTALAVSVHLSAPQLLRSPGAAPALQPSRVLGRLRAEAGLAAWLGGSAHSPSHPVPHVFEGCYQAVREISQEVLEKMVKG